MNGNDRPAFDLKVFLGLDKVGEGRTIGHYDKNQMVFAQGDLANAIFYLQKGRVKLTVLSHNGKEAEIAVLEGGEFFGEGAPKVFLGLDKVGEGRTIGHYDKNQMVFNLSSFTDL